MRVTPGRLSRRGCALGRGRTRRTMSQIAAHRDTLTTNAARHPNPTDRVRPAKRRRVARASIRCRGSLRANQWPSVAMFAGSPSAHQRALVGITTPPQAQRRASDDEEKVTVEAAESVATTLDTATKTKTSTPEPHPAMKRRKVRTSTIKWS